jgi:large subunit ribosomal protein L10
VAKIFYQEGGEITLAISKKQKQELVAEYREWLGNSKAVILAEYTGLTMQDIDNLRAKVREAGGEFHVVKNTLARLAFQEAGYPVQESFFEGSTAAGFSFKDATSVAKALSDFSKSVEFLKIKGGYLENQPMSLSQVTSLADLPSLPVMRSHLLGTLMAPASRLARTLNEPGRQLAYALKAYAEKDAATAAG